MLVGPAGIFGPPGFHAPYGQKPRLLPFTYSFEYGIPASIDDTGATDVTAAINAWIATLPDGAIARFGVNKTYRILSTIVLNARRNLRFNGNGSTFNQNTAPAVDNQAMWELDDCSGITITNMRLVGAFATPGTYNATFEHNHGIALFGSSALIDNVTITNVGGDLVYYGQGFTAAKNPSSGGWINSTGSGGCGRNAISYVSADGVRDHNLTFTSTIGLFGLDAEPNTGTNFYVNDVVAERIAFNCNIHSTTLQVTEGNPVSNVTYRNISTTDVQGVKVNLAQILGQTPVYRPQNITLDAITCPTQYTNSSTWVAQHIDGLSVINTAIPMWCVTTLAYLMTAYDCTSVTQSNNDRSVDAGPNFPAAGTVNVLAPTTVTGSITLSGTATATAGGSSATATGVLDLAGTVTAQAAATASGSLSLGGTSTAQALVTASGSLSLAGSSTAAAAATAAGSLTLGGSAAWVVPAVSGSLTLAGSATAQGAATASGSLSLSGSATARAAATASGSLTLAGTAAWTAPASSGSLTLSGTAAAQTPVTASGSLSLAGSGTAQAPVTATGSVTLAGTATAVAGGTNTASGSLTLGGSATAAASTTAAGSLLLGGSATAAARASTTGSLSLSGSAQGAAPVTATGSLTFTGSALAAARTTATGSITLTASGFASGTSVITGSIALAGTATAAVGADVTQGIVTVTYTATPSHTPARGSSSSATTSQSGASLEPVLAGASSLTPSRSASTITPN